MTLNLHEILAAVAVGMLEQDFHLKMYSKKYKKNTTVTDWPNLLGPQT